MTKRKGSRPTWDEYFLRIAFDVSLRSDDQFIKHGAVIVENKSRHMIASGYNGTIRGSDEDVIRPHDRDHRRKFMLHAECNSILNCSMNPHHLTWGATIYVTGEPCINCLQQIINFGIGKIVMADRAGTVSENEEIVKAKHDIIDMSGVIIDKIPMTNKWISNQKILL